MVNDLLVREARIAFIVRLLKARKRLLEFLDSVAEVADCSPDTANLLRDNVRSLTSMQETIAEAVISCFAQTNKTERQAGKAVASASAARER